MILNPFPLGSEVRLVNWICVYCGTLQEEKRLKCANCGAPREEVRELPVGLLVTRGITARQWKEAMDEAERWNAKKEVLRAVLDHT